MSYLLFSLHNHLNKPSFLNFDNFFKSFFLNREGFYKIENIRNEKNI